MSGAIMNKIWGAFGMDANEEEEEDYVENNEEMEEEEENNKENKFLVQDLKNQEVEFKQFDNIAKGAINTKTFIKIYLKE